MPAPDETPPARTVSGRFNVRDPRGQILPGTRRSATELVRLCLKAMGEREDQLTLPDGYPAVEWQDTPAVEAIREVVRVVVGPEHAP